MCGICGIYGLEDRALIEKMSEAIGHRGPDDRGYFLDDGISLGNTRLSIIDVEGGRQPILNEEGTLCLVFNGEIYNYLELRRELIEKGHDFRTRSDTEVIIHLYEEWGAGCVNRLEGMFAFALYDLENKNLFLARDPTGIKPLFYSWIGDVFVFASEIKSLFRFDGMKREIDTRHLKEKLIFEFLLGESTLFKGVKQVPAGCRMSVGSEGIRTGRYYRTKRKRLDWSEERLSDEIVSILKDSVEKRLMSEVPLGVVLSGGLDSGMIAAIHSELTSEPIDTFCVAESEENPDFKHARVVAEEIGSRHHEYFFDAEDIFLGMPDFIFHNENIDYTVFFFHPLFKNMKRNVTVGLCGQGADELFAGYPRYEDSAGWKQTLIGRIDELGPRNGFTLKSLIGKNYADLESLLRFEQKGQLSNFQLRLVDRSSMAFGLEIRVPFLDRKLVDLANMIPVNLKMRGGVEKYILRKGAGSLKLPKRIVKRKKMAAGTRTSPGELKKFEKECDKIVGDKYFKNHPHREMFGTKAEVLCFDLFNEMFVERKAAPPGNFSITELY